MPKKELSDLEKIKEATEDVAKALIQNVVASKAVVEAQTAKKAAHFTLQKAEQRLNALKWELME